MAPPGCEVERRRATSCRGIIVSLRSSLRCVIWVNTRPDKAPFRRRTRIRMIVNLGAGRAEDAQRAEKRSGGGGLRRMWKDAVSSVALHGFGGERDITVHPTQHDMEEETDGWTCEVGRDAQAGQGAAVGVGGSPLSSRRAIEPFVALRHQTGDTVPTTCNAPTHLLPALVRNPPPGASGQIRLSACSAWGATDSSTLCLDHLCRALELLSGWPGLGRFGTVT